ncbi:hypothetical protein FO519_009619 [Halicephalobus sp. NKZ332]|nr:hypothetical protein FO519_009619 [Halicephalobus sp. NKZ332]
MTELEANIPPPPSETNSKGFCLKVLVLVVKLIAAFCLLLSLCQKDFFTNDSRDLCGNNCGVRGDNSEMCIHRNELLNKDATAVWKDHGEAVDNIELFNGGIPMTCLSFKCLLFLVPIFLILMISNLYYTKKSRNMCAKCISVIIMIVDLMIFASYGIIFCTVSRINDISFFGKTLPVTLGSSFYWFLTSFAIYFLPETMYFLRKVTLHLQHNPENHSVDDRRYILGYPCDSRATLSSSHGSR